MSNTVTIELPEPLAKWLESAVKETGLPAEQIICEQLAASLPKGETRPFMRLAGSIQGLPSDLSSRKGFDRG